LLYEVHARGVPVLLHVFIEHQSTVVAEMVLRVLGFSVRIWERDWATMAPPRRLRPIVPLVLYHGRDRWTAATTLAELFMPGTEGVPGLLGLMPTFEMQLCDLARESDEALARKVPPVVVRLILLALRDVRDFEDALRWFARHLRLMVAVLAAPGGLAAFEVLLRYVYEVTETRPEGLWAMLQSATPTEHAEAIMSTAERLREEGRKQGIERGIERGRELGIEQGHREGRAESLLRMLALRFGSVPAEAERKVREAPVAQLDRWAERLLTAPTLDDALP